MDGGLVVRRNQQRPRCTRDVSCSSASGSITPLARSIPSESAIWRVLRYTYPSASAMAARHSQSLHALGLRRSTMWIGSGPRIDSPQDIESEYPFCSNFPLQSHESRYRRSTGLRIDFLAYAMVVHQWGMWRCPDGRNAAPRPRQRVDPLANRRSLAISRVMRALSARKQARHRGLSVSGLCAGIGPPRAYTPYTPAGIIFSASSAGII